MRDKRFTLVVYMKKRVQNNLMKICVVVNGLYAVAGLAALGMMILPNAVS